MRKLWKDKFKPGTPERESFEDMHKLVDDATAVGVLQVNFEAANTPVSVSHALKKVPTSFTLNTASTAVIVYATAADKALWTDKIIILRSNTTGEVGICVR